MIERISQESHNGSQSILTATEERTKRLTTELAPISIEGTFTVETYSRFSPQDLNVGDRCYVRTNSGNTYRIERSRTRPTMLKFLNEKTGTQEYGSPTRGKDVNFEVGKQMFFTAWNNPDDFSKGSQDLNSSSIRHIEIWRNYSTAIDETNANAQSQLQGNGLGGFIAAAAANTASGVIHSKDYRQKK